LKRVKTQYLARFVRGIERIGGFGGKSDVLAQNEVLAGSPDHYKVTLGRVSEVTAQELQATAKEWLSDGAYVLEVRPFPDYKTMSSDVDRSKVPTPGPSREVRFPELQRVTLSNGLKVILAQRHAVPVVDLSLWVDAGYAADQFATPGTAKLAMAMLDEGTRHRTSLQVSEELALLGATLTTGSNLDESGVSLSALKVNLDASLDIYADVILHPSFPRADFARLQKLQQDGIQNEKSEPTQMALRVFPRILYGDNHAYGNPFTGSGTTNSVAQLTRADVEGFHKVWFKPNNATIVVVGDTTLAEISSKLEERFKEWKPGEVPKKNVGTVAPQSKRTIYLMDRPGSIQSILMAAEVAPPKSDPDEIAIQMMNTILGGAFTSRINMNLREDKHWSYGALSILVGARGQRPFIVYSSVQTDKTRESMIEMEKELQDILGKRPITEAEASKALNNAILQLPGSWETMAAVSSSLAEIVRYGLPDDYFKTYPEELRKLSVRQLSAAAHKVVQPDRLAWLVVGDRSKIEVGIRALGFGEIQLVDPDGKPI
jgi:zinc protease